MEKFERTRRLLNRVSEPLRSDQPVPPEPDEDEAAQVAECVDADDMANT